MLESIYNKRSLRSEKQGVNYDWDFCRIKAIGKTKHDLNLFQEQTY